MADRPSSTVRWWMPLGAITLLLALYNSPWMRAYFPEAYQLKRWVFGLHREMNFAVWWSALLCLLSAALFFEIASGEERGRRRPYLGLALVMLAAVIDEIGSLHERISGHGGWASLAPFALLLLLLVADCLRLLWREAETRPGTRLVLAGVLLLVGVAVLGHAEHDLTSRQWSEPWGSFLDGTIKLLGALLILAGAAYHRRGSRWGGGVAAVVPDPTRMARLQPLVLVGVLAHLAAAQALYLPTVGQPRWYGSPAAIYPFVLFSLLACYAFWAPSHLGVNRSRWPEIRGFWSGVGLFFLLCSVGTMQNLWGFVGKIVPGLGRKWFYEPIPLWVGMILSAWFIGLALWRERRSRTLWLLALPLAPVIHLELDHLAAGHLASGLFALVCVLALLPAARQRGPGGAAGRARPLPRQATQ